MTDNTPSIQEQPLISEADKTNITANTANIRLMAGGDVMLGRQMPGWVALHGPSWPLTGVAKLLETADLALVNLETCVSTLGDFLDKGGRQPYYYHALPEMLDVLSAANIQCVTTANNHAMDYGKEALVQQCELLDAGGFLHSGSGRDFTQAALPGYAQINGLTIAFIGVETETPVMQAGIDTPGIFHAPIKNLLNAVAASIATARTHADIVIVTPHWGDNWQEAPSPLLRDVARGLIDLGADAVLGHSAHILQGVELHAGRPIVYDMGTLLFDRVTQNRMSDTALFELELDARGVRQITIHPVKLSRGQAHLATNNDAERIRNLVIQLSHNLNPATQFEPVNEGLRIVCVPPAIHDLKKKPPPGCFTQNTRPEVPAQYRQLRSNLVYDTLPVDCQWATPVVVNSALEILGARFATPVQPGRGFVCEVYFRAAPPPMPSRVEARLTALAPGGIPAFVYTHPVAEGIHPPSRWNRNEVICDRVLVRPGKELDEGDYDLYWQLVDLDKRVSIQVEGAHERLLDGKIFLGKLTVSQAAPKGVAGIAPALRIDRADAGKPYLAWKNAPLRFWETQARTWVFRALAKRGVTPKPETVTPVRNNPWGLVLSLQTDRGRVFFKALSVDNRFEPQLLAKLSNRWPNRIARPLAIQPAAGWMLTPDYGSTLLDIHTGDIRQDMWRTTLAQLAEIQIESCHNTSRWIELGVPDRQLGKLPGLLKRLLENDSALALGKPKGLLPEERDAALDMLPYFEQVCHELAIQPCSTGLDQGDLHMGNIVLKDSRCLFLDWDAASITHPFCSLLLPYDDTGLRDETALARLDWLAEAYLRPWCEPTGQNLETLTTTLHRALWVAHINRALNWASYASLNEKTAAGNTQILVARWIRFWLQRATLLTGKTVMPVSINPAITSKKSNGSRTSALATADNSLLLDIDTIARITGGEWHNLPAGTLLTGMCHSRKYLNNGTQGNLYFPINSNASDHSFSASNTDNAVRALRMGAVAAVVPCSATGLPDDMPRLRVENIIAALETMGVHVRDTLFTGQRVLVTGTEGKTGFKCMLHHVLTPQIPVHAILNSTNMDFSLYASLASIRRKDRIAILEAAGTHPGRCARRSKIVKPHLFVITEVGNEHMVYHGSQLALIEGKADICIGLMEGGYGILNADSLNYAAVREAVLARRNVPLLLFGSGPECNGRLLGKRFENNGWIVSANIEGITVEYRLPLLGEHAPLASVSVLLAAHSLGADVVKAAAAFADFVPYESQGVLRRTAIHHGEVLLFDNSSRASVLSYQSYLATAARLSPAQPQGRKIAMIGQMIFLGDEAQKEHERLAEWVDKAGFDCIIFVGQYMESTYARLKHPSRVVQRFPAYDRRHASKQETRELIDTLLDLIRPGDLVFIKGEVDEVGEYFQTLEIKPT